ncbi:MAG: hypothetical protein AB9856_00970 [Cellulosilyticaceae bacterium]
MTVLSRLKLELANKEYFDFAGYETLLTENGLNSTDTYDKKTMQRNLLLTVLDVLNMLTNDIDLFRKLSDDTTGFSQSEAYSQLKHKIADLKNRIDSIPIDEEPISSVQMLFSRRR